MADWTSPSSHSGAEDDDFRGRIGRLRQSGGTRGALGARLTKALKGGAPKSFAASRAALRPLAGDSRQRVVAKVSFHNHGFGGGAGGGSGGGGKLIAHAQYLERDGAGRELDNGEVERGQFYDREQDVADDARARLQDWSLEDKRHFRLMLAPESGARIVGIDGDLREFTRETMARVERDLGVKLDWLAVDHHNTHNPHTHVILRGVRRDGVDLLLPREYVAHGLREAARGVATQILGERGRADERLRLDREIESIAGFDPDLGWAVLHIILSHHGMLEHGSPVTPATREATLVHAMDNLGGKLGSFDRIERTLADGQAWSGFDRGIAGSAYFRDRAA